MNGKEVKPRYDLIPPELLEAVAWALTDGLDKRPERFWEENKMKWSDHFASLMRHLWAWWNPFVPDVDHETGKSHLWHAASRIAFLIAYEKRGFGENDKPKLS